MDRFLKDCQDQIKNTKQTMIDKKQIELLGGTEEFYEMINQKMKNHEHDGLFIKETFDLYKWRKDFFKKMFPRSSSFAIIPHMVTKEFDIVVNKASLCCKDLNEDPYDDDFDGHIDYGFRTDIDSSENADDLYDKRCVKNLLDATREGENYDHCPKFWNALPNFVKYFHSGQPKTLKEQSLKCVIKFSVDTDEPSKVLVKKLHDEINAPVKNVTHFNPNELSNTLTNDGIAIMEMYFIGILSGINTE